MFMTVIALWSSYLDHPNHRYHHPDHHHRNHHDHEPGPTWTYRGSWWRGRTCQGAGQQGRWGGWSRRAGGRTRWGRAGLRWTGRPGKRCSVKVDTSAVMIILSHLDYHNIIIGGGRTRSGKAGWRWTRRPKAKIRLVWFPDPNPLAARSDFFQVRYDGDLKSR